jgi:site-specific recombinase XerD
MSSAHGVGILREEAMRYRLPEDIFCDRRDAEYPFDELVASYCRWLETREKPASEATVKTVRAVLKSFRKSLVLHERPLVASNINPGTYDDWRADVRQARLPHDPHQRIKQPRAAKPMSAAKIASMTAHLKAFTHQYVHRYLDMTREDLLARVIVPAEDPPNKEGFTREEADGLLASHDLGTFLGRRDRALVAVILGSGLRFSAAVHLRVDELDRVTGDIRTIDKRRPRLARLSQAAVKIVREYLRVRPDTDCPELFVKEDGTPLTTDGARSIWSRLQRRSGVTKTPHRARNTIARAALNAGADPTLVQWMMGWASPAMVSRYAGEVHIEVAARRLPEFAPI